MSDRKSTTSTARTVYTSPEGRITVTRTEDADYILSVDDCCAGVYTNAHAAEQAGLVELEYRVKQERWLAADEAAYAAMRDMMRRADNASLDALEQSENEHADTLGAPEPDEPTPPDDDEADEAARNFTDEADEAAAAYQQAYRSGAASYGVADQATDAALAARDFGAEDAPADEYADALDLAADAQLAIDMRAAYDAAPTVPVALTTEPTPANVGEAVVAQWFGEWCEARALGEPQAWIDGKLQAIRTLGYYVVRPAGVGPWHLAAAVDGAWRIIATEPTPAAPRRNVIAHELPAFVEELRGLLAYLPDGGVWQSANGDIRLVQAPTRYAAALAAAEHYEAK